MAWATCTECGRTYERKGRHDATVYHQVVVEHNRQTARGWRRVSVHYEPFLAPFTGEYHTTAYTSIGWGHKGFDQELWAPVQAVEAAISAYEMDRAEKRERVAALKAQGLAAAYHGIRKYVPKKDRVLVPELEESVWAPAEVVAAAEKAKDLELVLKHSDVRTRRYARRYAH